MNEPTSFSLINGQVGIVHRFATYICHNEATSKVLKERAEAREKPVSSLLATACYEVIGAGCFGFIAIGAVRDVF